jgi:hypothetical protein
MQMMIVIRARSSSRSVDVPLNGLSRDVHLLQAGVAGGRWLLVLVTRVTCLAPGSAMFLVLLVTLTELSPRGEEE